MSTITEMIEIEIHLYKRSTMYSRAILIKKNVTEDGKFVSKVSVI